VDEGELAERCLAGDQAAIREFVEFFQGLVFGICLHQLKHREDAEDVAQQTMVRAIRHLRHWDTRRPLKPWVLAIAVNRCRTHQSRRNHQVRTLVPEIDAPTVEKRPRRLDLAEELELALAKLREDYRTCFVLFHQQELSITEVAEIMDCPEGTIKTWLHRARKEVAELLIERGVVTRDGYELHRV
jgi:RNA polymerase sigma-70 factor (ECF subfamily)